MYKKSKVSIKSIKYVVAKIDKIWTKSIGAKNFHTINSKNEAIGQKFK